MSAIKKAVCSPVSAPWSGLYSCEALRPALEAINHTHWAINRLQCGPPVGSSTSSARIGVAGEVAVTAHRRAGDRG